eukprot:m.32910 g.32910  ORF g.32910 m.32910 type:complete len:843 (+) comp31727_c0_seq4:87-2615(+)
MRKVHLLLRPVYYALRQPTSRLLFVIGVLVVFTVFFILSTSARIPLKPTKHSDTSSPFRTVLEEVPVAKIDETPFRSKSSKSIINNRPILFITSSDPIRAELKATVRYLLEANRLDFKIYKDIYVERLNLRLYSVIVLEGLSLYYELRGSLKEHAVGFIVLPSLPDLVNTEFSQKAPAFIFQTTNSSVLRILKKDMKIPLESPVVPIKMPSNSTEHVVLMNALIKSGSFGPVAVAMEKRTVLIGCVYMTEWFWKTLFLDALYYVSSGHFGYSLQRRILVDVDDIFVASSGTKMNSDDVRVMIDFQEQMREKVPGFKLNLGFSGHFYEKSKKQSEILGDREIVKQAKHFWWFGHMFQHEQPHKFLKLKRLQKAMKDNRAFAKNHNISVGSTHYSVAPHHSGVYPVHPLLYESWKSVWHVDVTSTEEYPHLRPAHKRRGFIYQDIKVLPRQTCTLFTKTYTFGTYPGGKARFHAVSQGELFDTILSTPFSVFMTHLSNYGNDRLALLLFQETVDFILSHTNLQLSTVPPKQMADEYFRLFPKDANLPLWTNPCSDPRHEEIWASPVDCTQFPDFIVVGPQKTGTTALHSFLGLHPHIKSNADHPKHFEELQFFQGSEYEKGVEYYMSFFPPKKDKERAQTFEKSATYFDSSVTPERMSQLLPQVKVVVILADPGKRAYSWYQHQKAHQVETAVENTFYDVLKSNESCPSKACSLRARCLTPGRYFDSLKMWMKYYDKSKIVLIDGGKLVDSPIEVMNELQKFLGVPLVDYDTLIRYDESKGFYCEIRTVERTKCLGTGKGRKYSALTAESSQYLKEYYARPNEQLRKLLVDHDWLLPQWLKENN